ncbi:MAG: hypothetical protein M9921_08165 [Fimbriimonadaceae bacterium]|nr:hypothetical protein [Fimbriimonadaceae bacterium]
MKPLPELTREELYDLVWSEALVTLAPRFGISSVALKKRCTKLGVPTPPRGYWAKVSAGRSPRRRKLPNSPPIKPKKSRDESAQNYFEGTLADYTVARPHKFTSATKRQLARDRPDYKGQIASHGLAARIRVSPESASRALWVLDGLLKALDSAGVALALRDGYEGGLFARLGADEAHICMRERVFRVPRTDPDPEPRTSYYGERTSFDHKPTGILRVLVKFELLADGEWVDKRSLPLDTQVEKVAEGIKASLIRNAEMRTRRNEEARLTEIRRQDEWKKRQEREAEEKRWRNLEQLAGQSRLSTEVALLADRVALAAKGHALDQEALSRVEVWLAWARKHAERLDPVEGVLHSMRTNRD